MNDEFWIDKNPILEKLIDDRHKARKEKNFELADKIAKELREKGFEIEDKKLSEQYSHKYWINSYKVDEECTEIWELDTSYGYEPVDYHEIDGKNWFKKMYERELTKYVRTPGGSMPKEDYDKMISEGFTDCGQWIKHFLNT